MKIGPIRLSVGARTGRVRLSARITSEGKSHRSSLLWFDLPEQDATGDIRDGTPWLQASLPWAFHHGEDIEIDARVDGVWLENSAKLLEIYSGWYPGSRLVKIRTSGTTVPAPAPERRTTGLFFTGGVDSFHTLYSCDQEPAAMGTPSYTVQDLIYVLGYDIPLRHHRSLAGKVAILEEVARRTGKNLIIASTNLRETFLSKVRWDTVMHGAALATVGMLLDRRVETLLVSAGGKGLESRPWGSHFLTDPLHSTSRTRVVRYADQVDRFSKLKVIANHPVALDYLHVCWVDESHLNCGSCEKCLRTMAGLELLGVLQEAGSFDQTSRSRILEKIRNAGIPNDQVAEDWDELRNEAKQRQLPELYGALSVPLSRYRSQGPLPRPPLLLRLKSKLNKRLKSLFR